MAKIHESNISNYKNKKSIEHYARISGKIKDIEKFIISKYFKGKVLDIGCGCGRTTSYLDENGFKVIGFDITEEMIDYAKKKFPKIDFRVGDACKMDFKDNSFDVAFFSFNGLDYIHPEKKRFGAIKEIERVLKPGGLFVYSSHDSKFSLLIRRPLFILRNLLRGSLFGRYKLEKDYFGEFYTYYAKPSKQIKDIQRISGLRYKRMLRGKNDLFPHYIFKKGEKK